MELHERRRRILAAVVDDYVETAEPIGSETLARKHDFGVKPATIRNELAAMSEMGYLRQPHTSAGRVPSDLGYRFYVDELMPPAILPTNETLKAKQSYEKAESEVEEILQKTCQILSGLTRYISLVTSPRVDSASISQVALLSVKPGKMLVVTVLSTGHIDHRTIDYVGNVNASDSISISNLINARFAGTELKDFAARADEEIPMELTKLEGMYRKAVASVRQALAAASDDTIYIDGTSHILRQPEFRDSDRLQAVLEALEHRRSIYETLSKAILGMSVTVTIGSENAFQEMHECSFIASSYSIGGRYCGSIGVIGPTRMDYRRATAAVRFMAQNLSDLLTSLSI